MGEILEMGDDSGGPGGVRRLLDDSEVVAGPPRHCLVARTGLSVIEIPDGIISDQNQWEYLMSKFEYVVYDPQWTEEERLNCDWSRYFVSTSLTSGRLGYGEKAFARKLQALWHQACLITGTDMSLDAFRKCILGISSDQAATERKIPDAPYLAMASDVSSGLDAVEKGEKRFVDVAKELFFFPRSVSCTNPMHMIWNSFEDSLKGEEALWTVYEKRLRGILLFLGHNQRRTRWLQIAPLTVEQKQLFLGWPYRLIS